MTTAITKERQEVGLPATHIWHRDDKLGVVRVDELHTFGANPQEWIRTLSKSLWIHPGIKDLLARGIETTSGVPMSPVIIPGKRFEDEARCVQSARDDARMFGFNAPTIEQGLVMAHRLNVTDFREMGVESIIVAHEPVIHDGVPHLLLVKHAAGDNQLALAPGSPTSQFSKAVGIMFVA